MQADEHVDVVVVGSGFGGSVTAYRLAQAGLKVCVLERGKTYPPGSFPRRPHEMAANFWDPSKGSHGLYNFWSFRGTEALVASGLGGGSLIYANVMLRKDEHWFTQQHPGGSGYETWPVTRADLDPHYDAVEDMIGVRPFPLEAPGFRDTTKTRAMRDAAGQLGLDWGLPNLAVSFAAGEGHAARIGVPLEVNPDYPNLHDSSRLTCRLCGECDIGCNDGAKNSLDHTYLSAARHHEADLRDRSEVRSIIPTYGGGYVVTYVRHLPSAEGHPTKTSKLPLRTIAAPRVVVAAGSLGSTYLLLRNRADGHLPGLGGDALGTRFCGNGDLLTMLLRSRTRSGMGATRTIDASRGPVITSYIRVPDEVDPGGSGPGYYIQDAGYPVFVDWLAEGMQLPSLARRALRFALQRVWAHITGNPQSDLSGELALLQGSSTLSSASLPLLGMGRDVPDGVMSLRRGYLDVKWTTATSEAYFARVKGTMADIAQELGARFRENPLTYLKRVITVHPLGGVPMGRTSEDGVVDAYGEVFGYPGLFVADGSVFPGPVGPNPSLTIAAFADRMATRMIERPTPVPTSRPLVAARRDEAEPATYGLRFTEEMKGHVVFGEVEPEVAARVEGARREPFMFHLDIEVDDVARFVADAHHLATPAGWVTCPPLGGRLAVESGSFNLFVDDDTDPDRRTMRYRLHVRDVRGQPFTLVGVKQIGDDPGFDVWADTTTLYVHLLRGEVPEPADGSTGHDGAEVVAAGELRILLRDFARQLTTFRVHGGTAAGRLEALGHFGRLFMGELWDLYHGRAGGGGGDGGGGGGGDGDGDGDGDDDGEDGDDGSR